MGGDVSLLFAYVCIVFSTIIFMVFFAQKPKVYWLILLLRIVGDCKSADRFIKHLKMIDKANTSPQYNFEEINNPEKYLGDMQRLYTKQVRDESYHTIYVEKTIQIELTIYQCINGKGKFVATTDYGKHWYLTGEDDAVWRKDPFESLPTKVRR
jgi:hypothetical protein